MTEKELHKLKRQDLLELLLAQGREAAELKRQLSFTEARLFEVSANYERMKKRVDLKDDVIRKLKNALKAEREKRRIDIEEAGSIAEAALRLNNIFAVAQKAADQYLYNIKLAHGENDAIEVQEPEENIITGISRLSMQRDLHDQQKNGSSDTGTN